MDDEFGEAMVKVLQSVVHICIRTSVLLVGRVNNSVAALQARLEQKGVLTPEDVLAMEDMQDELAVLHKELSATLEQYKEDLDNPAVQDVIRRVCTLTGYSFDRAMMRTKKGKVEFETEMEAQMSTVLKELGIPE